MPDAIYNSSFTGTQIDAAVRKVTENAAAWDAKPTTEEMNAAIAAIPTPDVSGQIATHNTDTAAHGDIRTAVTNAANKANSAYSTAYTAYNNANNLSKTKADKIVPATTGNVATLDANGNLADGGMTTAKLKPFYVAVTGTYNSSNYSYTYSCSTKFGDLTAAIADGRDVIARVRRGTDFSLYPLDNYNASPSYTSTQSYYFGPFILAYPLTSASTAASVTPTVTMKASTTLSINGGTMLGDLTLARDPTSALHAATKQYVDNTANSKASTATYTVSIPASWTENSAGGYMQTVTVSGMLATDNPIADVILGTDVDANALYLEAWALVTRITTAANSITLYANGDAPVTAFTIQLKVVR